MDCRVHVVAKTQTRLNDSHLYLTQKSLPIQGHEHILLCYILKALSFTFFLKKIRYKVYYQRHSTATRGKEHRETVGLVKSEAKQRYTPGEKGYGCLPSEKEHNKEMAKSFTQASFSGSLSS